MSTEVTEGTEALEKLLSLEASPAGALTAEQRSALNEAFEGADTEESLRSLLTVAQAALRQRPDNLRAQYSVALYRELTGDTEEAARTFLRLGRELAGRGDWRGVR